MTDEIKHETPAGHGGYERQDLQTSSILYFLLTILVGTAICMGVLRGIFVYLDHREKASQPPVNPLITNVPSDTRHIAPGYPQTAFPSPRLEEDERGRAEAGVSRARQVVDLSRWDLDRIIVSNASRAMAHAAAMLGSCASG